MKKIFAFLVIFSLLLAGTAFAEQRLMTYDTTTAKYKADSELISSADDLTISKNCTVTVMASNNGYYVGSTEVIDSSGNVVITQIPNGADLYIIGTDDITDISSYLSESGGIVYYKGVELGTGTANWDESGDNLSTGSLVLDQDLTIKDVIYADEISNYSGGSDPTAFLNSNGFTFTGASTWTGQADWNGNVYVDGDLTSSQSLTVTDFYATNLYYLDYTHTNDGELRRNGTTQAVIWSGGVKISNNLSVGANCAIRDNGGGDFEYSEDDGATWSDFGGSSLTQEQVDDYVDALINDADSTHTRVTITYDDADNAMDFVVDDMNDDTPEGADYDVVFSSNGIMTRTAASTYASRTITGTANEITVTNGDGVAGNPTLSLPADLSIDDNLTVSGRAVTGYIMEDFTIVSPKDLTDSGTLSIWSNRIPTQQDFNISAIYSTSDTDDTVYTLKETAGNDFTSLTTIEAITIATDGTSAFYNDLTSGIDHSVIEYGNHIVFDNDDTDNPKWIKFVIVGYYADE